MKKLLVIILVMSFVCLMVACTEPKSELDTIKDKVSYEEVSKKVGENEVYRVEITTIKGETAPMLDGVVGSCTDRCLVRVKPVNVDKMSDNLAVKLEDNDNTLDVSLSKDVLGLTYSASLDSDVYTFDATSIAIIYDDKEVKCPINCVVDATKMDNAKALEIAYNELKADMSGYFDDGKFMGEAVVKLIHNNKMTNSPYFYYVSFAKSKEECMACLIDPESGKVINKKTI